MKKTIEERLTDLKRWREEELEKIETQKRRVYEKYRRRLDKIQQSCRHNFVAVGADPHTGLLDQRCKKCELPKK